MILSGRFMNLSRLTDRYVICNVYYYVFLFVFFSLRFFDPSSRQGKKTQFFITSPGLN